MSHVTGIEWYAMGPTGVLRIHGWTNDFYFVQHYHSPSLTNMVMASHFISPIYQSLSEFQQAYPEYFI